MSVKSDRVDSEAQDSRMIDAPTDPTNWEPAALIPAQSLDWADLSPYCSRVSKVVAAGSSSKKKKKSKRTLSTFQTAKSTSGRTAKASRAYSTGRTNTTRSSMQKSGMASTQQQTGPASTQKTDGMASTQSTSVFTASTQKSTNPLLSNEFGLKLSKENMDVIKADVVKRFAPNGEDLPEEKQTALTTIEVYSSHLETRLRECGQYLDEMLGERFVHIHEARKAMEQIVSKGIITAEEVLMSPDCEKLGIANQNDVITIRSLSNIVGRILNSRRTA